MALENLKQPKNKDLLDWALYYLSKGFPVFPVNQEKKPVIKSWSFYQKQKPTESEVRDWFSKTSAKGIAIVTGRISGLIVLDFEKKEDPSKLRLPQTLVAKTGGGGKHLYFQYPLDYEVGNFTRIKPETDLKAEGGYIIAPPSLHKTGNRYEWEVDLEEARLASPPDWLLAEFQRKKKTSQDWQKAFKGVPLGERNQTATEVAGKLLYHLPIEEWETAAWPSLLGWNRTNDPPLEERELRGIFDSIKAREVSQKKLKKKTKGGGTKDDKTNRACSVVLEDGSILETIYDSKEEKTSWAIYRKGEVEYQDSLKLPSGKTLRPASSKNEIIKKEVIKLPKEAKEYGSEAKLLEDIQGFFHKYLDVVQFHEKLCSYYVLLSWVYDCFNELPYLRALGDYGSGKSRFLDTVGSICYKAIIGGGAITSAALFRTLDIFQGTLVVDEMDFKKSDLWTEIIKVFNLGYEKNRGVVLRWDKDEREPKAFRIFGCKLLATREKFQDLALESRCLTLEMEETTRSDIPENLPEEFWIEAQNLRNKLLLWRLRSYGKIEINRNLRDKTITPRLNQIILPLLSIIKDEKAKAEIKTFIRKYNQQLISDRKMTVGADIIREALKLLERGEEPLLSSIADGLNEEYSYSNDDKNRFTGKKVGYIIRTKLKLYPERGMYGYRISRQDYKKVRSLAQRYGVESEVKREPEKETQDVEKKKDSFSALVQ